MGNITEKDRFALMYDGVKNRDASSKISGYIYQDLLAIEKLLDGETECVATEFLEDVTYIAKDGLHIIQVKHYPKSNPKWNEIIKDLYYQYLKYVLLGGEKKVYLELIIHHKTILTKKTRIEILKILGIDDSKLKEDKISSDETIKILKNIHGDKEEKRDKFITQYAYKESIDCFYNNLIISSDIGMIDKKNAIKETIKKIMLMNNANWYLVWQCNMFKNNIISQIEKLIKYCLRKKNLIPG